MSAEAAPRLTKTKRVSSVEFWRFLFTVLVALYHFEIFFPKRTIFLSGSSAVEFFFVLAGFTLAMSAANRVARGEERPTAKEAHRLALDYVKKKCKALWPIMVCWLILWTVLSVVNASGMSGMGDWMGMKMPTPLETGINTVMNSEWEMLFLVGTPFGFQGGFAPNVPLWFLTALIMMGYLYTYAINRHYDLTRFLAPVIGVGLYVFFALNTTSTLDHNIALGHLNAGMVKAAAEMGFGISLYLIYERMSARKWGVGWKVLFQIIELYAIYRLFSLMIGQELGLNNYRRILYIMAILLFSFLNVTPLTHVLNNGFSRLLGKLTMPMYILHYNLISSYFGWIFAWKMELFKNIMDPTSRALYNFLDGLGGYDKAFKANGLTVKDAVVYMVIVIVFAIAALLLSALVRKIVHEAVAAWHKRQEAKAEAAAAEDAPAETSGETETPPPAEEHPGVLLFEQPPAEEAAAEETGEEPKK